MRTTTTTSKKETIPEPAAIAPYPLFEAVAAAPGDDDEALTFPDG
jgi:hypothetical protein